MPYGGIFDKNEDPMINWVYMKQAMSNYIVLLEKTLDYSMVIV